MNVELGSREISVALEDLIVARASRGNVQSKHGLRAAAQYELWLLTEALDRLMTQEQNK